MKTKIQFPDKKYFDFDGTDPSLNWIYILIIYFAAVVYFVGGGVSLSFSKGDADASLNQKTPPVVAVLRKPVLDKVINQIQVKESDRTIYLAGYSGPSDPSGL